jgi:uncharacterized membrane protein
MNDENDHTNKSWLNPANILITLVLILILSIVIWNQSLSEKYFAPSDLQETIAATSTATPIIVTPIPSEFYSDPADTSSILIAALVLLVIIFGSAFWKLHSNR